MIFINSSVDFAFLSALVNSSSIRNTESLLNTSRCILSSVSGAAIRNIRFTGCPSSASNSAPSGITIAASPGFVTASDLQCGMAIPSPIPVVPSSSLANTPFLYFSILFILPLFAIRSTILFKTFSLSAALPFNSILLLSSKSVIFIKHHSFQNPS